jgi:endonuclease/exonuclease/phosphatase (EEP) superfamily protein YafD
MQLNVCYANKDYDETIRLIKGEGKKADIIFMQEVVPALKERLAELKKIFPYQVIEKGSHFWGFALLSRFPLLRWEKKFFESLPLHHMNPKSHYLKVTFRISNQSLLTFYGVHLPAPMTKMGWQRRNSYLRELSQVISQDTSKFKVLVGDFNTTPSSTFFTSLWRESRLKFFRPTLGSFPDCVPDFLRISIDHFMASENIYLIQREPLPLVNSDHIPILTTIAFNPNCPHFMP